MGEPAEPPPDCDPCDDACPPDDGWPCELLEPLLPLVGCGGKGDSLPPPDWLELGLPLGLLLGLPPDDDGIDGIWVDVDVVVVVVVQPTRPSAKQRGQARPWM